MNTQPPTPEEEKGEMSRKEVMAIWDRHAMVAEDESLMHREESEARAAIEAVYAERDAYKADALRYRELLEMHEGEFPQFGEQLRKAEAERDELFNDLKSEWAQVKRLEAERDALRAERDDLKQAYWEARAIMGFDNDGDPTPAALTYPNITELMKRDAMEIRRDYDDAPPPSCS